MPLCCIDIRIQNIVKFSHFLYNNYEEYKEKRMRKLLLIGTLFVLVGVANTHAQWNIWSDNVSGWTIIVGMSTQDVIDGLGRHWNVGDGISIASGDNWFPPRSVPNSFFDVYHSGWNFIGLWTQDDDHNIMIADVSSRPMEIVGFFQSNRRGPWRPLSNAWLLSNMLEPMMR